VKSARSIRLGVAAMLALPALGMSQSISLTDDLGRERRCQPAEKPKRLPAVADLVDSVALVRTLAESGQADTLLLSLLFDDAGRLTTVRPIEGRAAPPAGLAEAIRSSLKPQKVSGPWAIRLRMSASGPLVQLERSVYCPAAPAQPELSSGTMRIEMRSGDRMPPATGKIRVDAEVRLDAQGTPINVDLRQGSGLREIDEETMRRLQTERFLPALVDGLAVPSWYRTDGSRTRF
jgi:hypothetical protein